jgi:hypothetical protein
MSLALRALALLSLALAATGCTMHRPAWLNPGDKDWQRSKAVLRDPFPDPYDAPEVDGGRPPSYDAPPPDFVRQQESIQNGIVLPWGRPR